MQLASGLQPLSAHRESRSAYRMQARLHGVVRLHQELLHHAGLLLLVAHVDGDLVGFYLQQEVVFCDGIPWTPRRARVGQRGRMQRQTGRRCCAGVEQDTDGRGGLGSAPCWGARQAARAPILPHSNHLLLVKRSGAPGFFAMSAMVPSDTESPIEGTSMVTSAAAAALTWKPRCNKQHAAGPCACQAPLRQQSRAYQSVPSNPKTHYA